uniref:Uncharacterized protein n=1 Tax=Timema douglasi TaxID=61478 RepID=A0A7R8VVY5_TIMDO|nr:unnamed protein product [Timema douglasi]
MKQRTRFGNSDSIQDSQESLENRNSSRKGSFMPVRSLASATRLINQHLFGIQALGGSRSENDPEHTPWSRVLRVVVPLSEFVEIKPLHTLSPYPQQTTSPPKPHSPYKLGPYPSPPRPYQGMDYSSGQTHEGISTFLNDPKLQVKLLALGCDRSLPQHPILKQDIPPAPTKTGETSSRTPLSPHRISIPTSEINPK